MEESGYNLPEMDAALAGTPFSGRLHYFPTIHSTNSYAIEQAQAGAASGSVYLADEQTAGRGRGGHTWHSAPESGLYVSVLLRPPLSPDAALPLSLATGIAVRQAIAEVCGLTADIRWPNDVLLSGRKCCGILVETAVSGGAREGDAVRLRHVVVGVGINVNQTAFPEDLASLATSLRIESSRAWPRQTLLLALLSALDREVNSLATGVEGLLERFEQASTWVRGKRVQVEDAGALQAGGQPTSPPDAGGYTGVTEGLDARGFLLVRTAAGIRTVLSGGVRELS
ncbi:MAG: biotin--[acetyl-CoA-carboxylase] ligase [Acidobacteriaceae bacterium]